MATTRVLVTLEWDENATTGPDYGNEPVTPEFVLEYLRGAGENLVPGVTLTEARLAD